MTQKKTIYKYDIAIIGGGLAGLTMAAVLDAYGFNAVCIDRDKPQKQATEKFDGRTTAISAGSKRLLNAIGVWDEISDHACAIEQIRVADGTSPKFLHFDSIETGLGDFGWIIENFRLRRALMNRIEKSKTVTHLTGVSVDDFKRIETGVDLALSDNTSVHAPLVIGADGVNSKTREWLNIPVRKWGYDQTAIVCTVGHELDHENIAVEHFMPAGPFAILPMTDDEKGTHRSSLVWTEHGGDAPEILSLSDKDFNEMLSIKFGGQLGAVKAVTKPQSFSLDLCHAKQYVAPNVVLIAEAAHRIHPIAGQGLNLSMRDIACLSEVLVEARSLGLEYGSLSVLQKYEDWRRRDNLAMAVMTDGLNRLFSNNIGIVKSLRTTGLGIINRIPPAKRFFEKQAMGLSGRLPRIIKTGKL